MWIAYYIDRHGFTKFEAAFHFKYDYDAHMSRDAKDGWPKTKGIFWPFA